MFAIPTHAQPETHRRRETRRDTQARTGAHRHTQNIHMPTRTHTHARTHARTHTDTQSGQRMPVFRNRSACVGGASRFAFGGTRTVCAGRCAVWRVCGRVACVTPPPNARFTRRARASSFTRRFSWTAWGVARPKNCCGMAHDGRAHDGPACAQFAHAHIRTRAHARTHAPRARARTHTHARMRRAHKHANASTHAHAASHDQAGMRSASARHSSSTASLRARVCVCAPVRPPVRTRSNPDAH